MSHCVSYGESYVRVFLASETCGSLRRCSQSVDPVSIPRDGLKAWNQTLRFRFKGYIPKLEERLMEEWGKFGTTRRLRVTIELGFGILMVLQVLESMNE